MTPSTSPTSTLGSVLSDLGPGAELVAGDDAQYGRNISGASIWSGRGAPARGAGTVLICPMPDTSAELTQLLALIPPSPSRVLIMRLPSSLPRSQLVKVAGDHAIVLVHSKLDPAEIVLAINRSTEPSDAAVSRRLSALQRSLTQVLSESEPIPALLNKVKTMCNATAALIDKRGNTVHSTGPLPLNVLMKEITSTEAASQSVSYDGWLGLADRINDPTQAGDHFGWLVVVARRPDFPDAYASAAIHVATTLVEASRRMTYVAQSQERAIRSAVLEEALALESRPKAPELTGRIVSLGLSFAAPLHAVVCQPIARARSARARRGSTALMEEAMTRLLSREGVPYLVSPHDRYLTLLVQSTPAALRRLVIAEAASLPDLHMGVGRRVADVADISDSFHDAQLAVRSLTRATSDERFMSYDEFDFAMRLFSDVGLDSMLAWAERFLAPLDQKGPLFESLVVFFEHNQNINVAAEILHVHHNSLRYRLAKAEELLQVNLRDPAALSSVFLALAAVDLGHMHSGGDQQVRGGGQARSAEIEAPRPAELVGRDQRLGVVLRPEH